jgi:O-antigen/teichoic acid export membrane protein
VEFYYKKSTQIARATVIATVANLVLNLLLIPIGSYIGSAYATLISNILLILMHYMGYRKCHNRIYNDRYILALSVVIIAFALISNVLYSLPILRFLLLGAILLTGLLNIKKILGIVKSILKNKA